MNDINETYQGAGQVSMMTKSDTPYRMLLGGLRILAVYVLFAWILDHYLHIPIHYLLPFISWLGWT